MEKYFATFFEDDKLEESSLLLLSLTKEEIIQQDDFTDHEIDIIRNLANEKFLRQKPSKYTSLRFCLISFFPLVE